MDLKSAIATLLLNERATREGNDFLNTLREAAVVAPDSFEVIGDPSSHHNPLDLRVCGLRVWVAAAVSDNAKARIEFGRLALSETGALQRIRDGVMPMEEARSRMGCRAHGEAFLLEIAGEIRRSVFQAGFFDQTDAVVDGVAVKADLR